MPGIDGLSRLVPGSGSDALALIWQVGVPAATALLTVVMRRSGLRALKQVDWLEIVREVALLTGGLTLYKWARTAVEPDAAPAFENAARILDLERALGLQFEPRIQEVALRSDAAVEAFNANYAYGFLPLVIAALIWLYMTDRREYGFLRNAIAISVLPALATFAFFPVAPPRLVADAGVVDTILLKGGDISFTNEYAAVPSLHVGWMAVAGFCVWRSARRPIGLLAMAPALLMALTVVATGYHFWLDGVVGVAYCLAPAILLPVVEPRRRRSRGPAPAGGGRR